MKDIEYERFRAIFRKTLAGKTFAEVRSMRTMLEKMMVMSGSQVFGLMHDLRRLEEYLAKNVPVSEQFNDLMKKEMIS